MKIVLPFPPAIFSGHANGNRKWEKILLTHEYRAHACKLTQAFDLPPMPVNGDIRIDFHFVPPDNRGDRCNYPGRMKAQIDGIAEALGVNDRRFLPSYSFGPIEKPGCVIVTIGE